MPKLVYFELTQVLFKYSHQRADARKSIPLLIQANTELTAWFKEREIELIIEEEDLF